VKPRKARPIFALDGALSDPLVRVSPVMHRKWREAPKCVGSSFYIGAYGKSALFVTARHVLRDIEGKPAEAFVLLPTYPTSVSTNDEPNGLKTLNVTKICGSDPLSDAAILVTEMPSIPPPQPFIDTDCPRAGDRCAALGYSEFELSADGGLGWAETKPELEFNFRSCRGLVEQVFPRRRDASMITFPCFQFDTIDRPGMSGGPVVNSDGNVIGIVSSGYDTGPSYAVLIAMLAELKVETSLEVGVEVTSIADLIAKEKILNKAKLSFSIIGQNESTVVTWR
jgi:S1-C subfamily serine protease